MSKSCEYKCEVCHRVLLNEGVGVEWSFDTESALATNTKHPLRLCLPDKSDIHFCWPCLRGLAQVVQDYDAVPNKRD